MPRCELVDLLFLGGKKKKKIVCKSFNIYFSNSFDLGWVLDMKKLRTTGFIEEAFAHISFFSSFFSKIADLQARSVALGAAL